MNVCPLRPVLPLLRVCKCHKPWSRRAENMLLSHYQHSLVVWYQPLPSF